MEKKVESYQKALRPYLITPKTLEDSNPPTGVPEALWLGMKEESPGYSHDLVMVDLILKRSLGEDWLEEAKKEGEIWFGDQQVGDDETKVKGLQRGRAVALALSCTEMVTDRRFQGNWKGVYGLMAASLEKEGLDIGFACSRVKEFSLWAYGRKLLREGVRIGGIEEELGAVPETPSREINLEELAGALEAIGRNNSITEPDLIPLARALGIEEASIPEKIGPLMRLARTAGRHGLPQELTNALDESLAKRGEKAGLTKPTLGFGASPPPPPEQTGETTEEPRILSLLGEEDVLLELEKGSIGVSLPDGKTKAMTLEEILGEINKTTSPYRNSGPSAVIQALGLERQFMSSFVDKADPLDPGAESAWADLLGQMAMEIQRATHDDTRMAKGKLPYLSRFGSELLEIARGENKQRLTSLANQICIDMEI